MLSARASASAAALWWGASVTRVPRSAAALWRSLGSMRQFLLTAARLRPASRRHAAPDVAAASRAAHPSLAEARHDRLARRCTSPGSVLLGLIGPARLGQPAGRLQVAVEMTGGRRQSTRSAAAWCSWLSRLPRWAPFRARANVLAGAARGPARRPRRPGQVPPLPQRAMPRCRRPAVSTCHTELAPSLKAGTGFHGRLPSAKRDACQSCHPDHRGRDFPLIEWPGGASIRPRANRLAAQGRARQDPLRDCHQRALIVDRPSSDAGHKQPRRTTLARPARQALRRLPLRRAPGELGARLPECHTETAWKPAPASITRRRPIRCGASTRPSPAPSATRASKDDAASSPNGAFRSRAPRRSCR